MADGTVLFGAVGGAFLPGQGLVDVHVGGDVGVAAAFGEQRQLVDGHGRYAGEGAGSFEAYFGVAAQVDDVLEGVAVQEEPDVGDSEVLEVVGAQDASAAGRAAVGRGEAAEVAGVDGTVQFDPPRVVVHDL